MVAMWIATVAASGHGFLEMDFPNGVQRKSPGGGSGGQSPTDDEEKC